MKSLLRFACLLAILFGLLASLQARTFLMKDGNRVDGEVVSFKNGMIVIAKDGGGKGLYTLASFSDADQAYLREQFPQGNQRKEVKGTASKPQAPPKPVAAQPSSDPVRTASAHDPDKGHPGLKTLRKGMLAPEIKGRVQGKSEYVSIEDLRGKLVVVHFWSTRVPPSVEEVKGLAYLYEQYHDRGLEYIGVAMDGSQRRLNDVEEELGVTWPMRLDDDRETVTAWGVTALPTNVLVDQVGVIQDEHMSAQKLQKLLAEAFGPPR